MKERSLSALALVIVLALAFVLKVFVSPYFFDAFITAVVVVMTYEFSKIMSKMGRYNNQEISIIASGLMCLVIALSITFGLGFYSLLIGFAVIVFFALVSFLKDIIFKKETDLELRIRGLGISRTSYAFKKAINTVFTLVYPALLMSMMIFLNHFELFTAASKNFGNISLFVLLFAFLIPIFTDTFAMLMGSVFGGKKLCPKISPNKTISGAIGGALACVVLCLSVFLLFNQIESYAVILNSVNLGISNIWKLLIVSLLGSVVCQFGDILESYFKRKADVKDSGKILPGHGGLLDRFDSYIFLVPYILIAFIIIF